PDVLPVLPLPDGVVFPLEIVPLESRDPNVRELVDDAMRANRLVALVYRGGDRLRDVGVAATIHRVAREEDVTRLLLQGTGAIRLEGFARGRPSLVARIVVAADQEEAGPEVEALARTVRDLFLQLASDAPAAMTRALAQLASDPVQLAYVVAANVT